MKTPNNKINKIFNKIRKWLRQRSDIRILKSTPYFNQAWYLEKNPEVRISKIDPYVHYLKYGGLERRDPGPDFSSSWYLKTYKDVRIAKINPLIHYLRFGHREGRSIHSSLLNAKVLRYQCPVCDQHFDDFLPLNPIYETNKRKFNNPYASEDCETLNVSQYQCPICHASDRERLYALYLSKKLALQPKNEIIRLLDFAPSKSLRDFFRCFSNIEYTSADKFMDNVDLKVDIMDMHSIQSESFDAFICSHVLEHVENDRIALNELFRILRHGGFGILMVPINLKVVEIDEDPFVKDIAERWRRFGQDDHVRIYSKQGFLQRVKDTGFIVNQYGIDFFGKEIFFNSGITPSSVLYIVEKK